MNNVYKIYTFTEMFASQLWYVCTPVQISNMDVDKHYSALIDGIVKLQILTGHKIINSFFLKNGTLWQENFPVIIFILLKETVTGIVR
jgi:hypothetical protein